MLHKTAIFPGSFDPFTLGHQSLVSKGLTLFDEIVIAIGINEQKRGTYTTEERIAMIRKLYDKEPRVRIESYSDLTVAVAQRLGAGFILRGVRSSIDFEYERLIAETNRSLTGIETVLLFAEPSLQHITSSVVRELIHFKQDVGRFLPTGLELPTR